MLPDAAGPDRLELGKAEAGISLDTLRKIERGAIAAPAFFTVAALARALGLDLTELGRRLAPGEGSRLAG